jgi:hypothetical protein
VRVKEVVTALLESLPLLAGSLSIDRVRPEEMIQFIAVRLSDRLLQQAEQLADEFMDSFGSEMADLIDSLSPPLPQAVHLAAARGEEAEAGRKGHEVAEPD